MLKLYKIRILLAVFLGFCVHTDLLANQCFDIEHMPSIRELDAMVQKTKENATKTTLIAVNEAEEESTETENFEGGLERESRFESTPNKAIAMRSQSSKADSK